MDELDVDDLVIRPCREEDLVLLEQVSPSPGTSRFHDRRHARQLAGEVIYLIAWLDGSPVGNLCLILGGPDNREAQDGLPTGPEINAFDVIPALRDRGIGASLIRAAEGCARDLGHSATVLGVEVDNHAARRLYERLGYRDWPHGEMRDSYTWTDDTGSEQEQEETVVWMEKRLEPAAMMASVEEVEVVVAHQERATLRVGDVFLKIDADPSRTDVEVKAMALAPVPTPRILWRKPPVLALAALPGVALGRLEEPSTASSEAWVATGSAVRAVHDAPLPPWPGRSVDDLVTQLASECEWLIANDVLTADVVTSNRRRAETVFRPWTPVFIHGDLQIAHVFVDGDEVTGIIDWSEASPGDALFDLATLTLAHEERLDDVIVGYGADVDRDLIRAWWSLRCLLAVRWLAEHGYGSPEEFPEVAVLRSQA